MKKGLPATERPLVPFHLIEPLESRIAPATIFAGKPGVWSDESDYNELPFHAINGSQYEALVGTTANGYYLELHAGDTLKLFSVSSAFQNFLKVNSGTAVAFFVDSGNTNEVDSNELTGLALGAGSNVQVFGEVHGDVVTNLNPDFTLSSDLAGRGISALEVTGGSVYGNIIAGGNIANVKVTGQVDHVYAGTAGQGVTFDFNGTLAGGGVALTSAVADGVKGAQISKSSFGGITEIHAGDGGLGAKGGSISSVTLVSDTNGFTVQAGAGGGSGGAFANGGAGGQVTKFYANGPGRSEPDLTLNNAVFIAGGAGGSAIGTGKGGDGGVLKEVYVGYRLIGGAPTQSDGLSRDNVTLQGGAGGGGVNGGVGGSLSSVKVATTTPDSLSTEIQLIGGAGGSGSTGKAGAGGGVSNYEVRNQNLDSVTGLEADILVQGGDGGSLTATGKGANGGSVTNGKIVGAEVSLIGGNGSDGGAKGGKGGMIDSLTLLNDGSGLPNAQLVLIGGTGGASTSGAGGAGGGITGITNLDADLRDEAPADLTLHGVIATAGAGGAGQTKGGSGGSLSAIKVTDTQVTYQAAFSLSSGGGGDAVAGNGGKGGAISQVSFSGTDSSISVFAGLGGSSLNGKGGKGGSLTSVGLASSGLYNGLDANGSVFAGNGGSGAGAGKSGGTGGALQQVILLVDGSALFGAGDGGAGNIATGQAVGGTGGGISNSSIVAVNGSVNVSAGDAGTAGLGAAKGGSVTGSVFQGGTSLLIQGGNGAGGGTGGDLSDIGFSGVAGGTPSGTVTLFGGQGSAVGSLAGKGGSVIAASGNAGASGTVISAGDIVGTGTKGAAGGSISDLTLLGGGGAVVTIEAGDGSAADVGGAGGDVNGVVIAGANMESGTIIRSIAAGDGGAGAVQGGKGGSVLNVNVDGLGIGVMSGAAYGFTAAGGIFAGVGGAGPSAGVNGNVQSITAQAISSIVAGRSAAPQLVTLVDKIYLAGTTAPPLAPDGGDAGYSGYLDGVDGYNLVGSVQTPGAVDGTKFHFTDGNSNNAYDLGETPLDGLIAALTLTTNRNFTPGAYLGANGLIDANV